MREANGVPSGRGRDEREERQTTMLGCVLTGLAAVALFIAGGLVGTLLTAWLGRGR
jgi:hypothetical protein